MIHAFRFAPISRQLICHDMCLFLNRIPKISNLISNQILIFLNRIFTVQAESPNVLVSRFSSQSWLGFTSHCLHRNLEGFLWGALHYSSIEERIIVISDKRVCLTVCVCLSVRDHNIFGIFGTACPIFTNFLCMLNMAVALSLSGGVMTCYLLPFYGWRHFCS